MAKKPLSEEAKQVLQECTIDGHIVRLPKRQLERKLYEEVNKHLQGIGGKWVGRSTQGFKFEHDPTELLKEQATGAGINLKQDFQFFATPPELAKRMASLLPNCNPGMKVLEPSAGDGSLVKAIHEYHSNEIEVDCFELMPLNTQKLMQLKNVKILGEDFLKAGIEGVYDAIIANPPFTKGQDVEHINAMYKALKTNGRMVVLASPSYTFNTQKKFKAFREFLDKVEAFQEELPAGTFSESGTNIRTMLIVIDKLETVETVVPFIPKGFQPMKIDASQFIENPEKPKTKKRNTKPNHTMSKIIFNNDALNTALKKVNGIIPNKPALPVILNVLIQVKGTDVSIRCTDIEVTMIQEIACENPDNENFDVLVPFKFLKDVVEINKTNTLEFQTNGNKLILKGLNDTYEVNVLEAVDDFPKMPDFPDSDNIQLPGDFIPWVNSALATVSTDTLRPSMCMVCLELDERYMRVVSTNGNVLYRRVSIMEISVTGFNQLLISKKVANALLGFEQTEIYWSDSHIAFKCGNVSVLALRHTEKYPDYKGIIPARTANMDMDRSLLVDAFEKVMLGADASKNVTIKLTNQIGRISIEAINIDMNRSAYVDVPADFKGECEKVVVNADNMLKLLKQVSFSNIALSIEEPNKAIVLTTESDEGYLSLIMPNER